MDNQNFQNNSYEQPDYQQSVPPEQPQKADTLAIVSLVLGIAAIILGCCVTYLGIGLGIGGIVCSVMSKKKQKSGLATAGMVCSIVGIVFAVIWIIFSALIMGILAKSGYDLSSFTNL